MPVENASGSRKARPQRRGQKTPLYAAVDLGTNNCRLLIARREQAGFRVVDSYSQVVRLGEGLATSGRLSDASIERAMTALKAIRHKLKNHKVGKVRCIATEACRKAENGAEFIAKARDETGLTFKIIGPNEEARLAAIGCHDLIDDDAKTVMVLDIGGGSTEISFVDLQPVEDRSMAGLLKNMPIKAWRSFPLGVVTLTESFADAEQPYLAMLDHAKTLFADWKTGVAFSDAMSDGGAYTIGTSGTVTCLAGVHLRLERYRRDKVDGIWMSPAEMQDIIDELIRIGREGRVALPTIGAERADLMLAGCAILEAAWSVWPTARLRVADRGLREGVLLSMMYGKPKRRRRGRRGKRSDGAAISQGSAK